MNADIILAEFRQRVGDTARPYLCSDYRAMLFMNEAEQQAARRARLLVDSQTAEICEVALEVGEAMYDLDPRVVFIRRARLEGRGEKLRRLYVADLDAIGTQWEEEAGEVDGFVTQLDTGKFRPYRIPEETGTVHLTVVRLPLEDIRLGQQPTAPEIATRWHMHLIDWMEYRYFQNRDEEVYDPKRSGAALVAFETTFGAESTAIDEEWIARNHGFVEDEGLF